MYRGCMGGVLGRFGRHLGGLNVAGTPVNAVVCACVHVYRLFEAYWGDLGLS